MINDVMMISQKKLWTNATVCIFYNRYIIYGGLHKCIPLNIFSLFTKTYQSGYDNKFLANGS